MGNVLDLLPPQRGQRGDNLVNLYSTPIEPTNTALAENKLFGEEWVAPRVGLKWLDSKKNIYYVWRDNFTCLIQDLRVFGHLPDLQDIHRVNVIIPCMAHVYRVLGALINLQKSYLCKENHLSDPPSISHFQFVVADDHLWTYQNAWQSYQNALRITYAKSPDNMNTEQELRLQGNGFNQGEQVHPQEHFIKKIHEQYNGMLNGRYSHDEELPPEYYQGFSRQRRNTVLEPSNQRTLEEVLAHYHKVRSKEPRYRSQTAHSKIRNKEENVPVISAETKVTPQVNSRGL